MVHYYLVHNTNTGIHLQIKWLPNSAFHPEKKKSVLTELPRGSLQTISWTKQTKGQMYAPDA